MSVASRLGLASITTQITGIVAISVLLGVSLIAATLVLLVDGLSIRSNVTTTVRQIAQTVQILQSAENSYDREVILRAIRKSGIEVEELTISGPDVFATKPEMSMVSTLVARHLKSGWGIEVVECSDCTPGRQRQLVARLDDDTALAFEAPSNFLIWHIVWAPTVIMLVVVVVFVGLLSFYALRWIIGPLSSLAAAAESFGRNPAEVAVTRKGPREIAQVADAMNEMRTRIRNLLDDRTRMLAAISHDLRTPLTRLRLRAERVADENLREGMLHEVEQISRLLNETLDYLRQDARSEDMARIDLPSLLQTVCTEFSDVGHDVRFEGPSRLTWVCRPSALTRAVTNIVANAVKHGTAVSVRLSLGDDEQTEILVSDDGPGIPDALRERVFEPFFKVDDARTSVGGGFGLGLSIARDAVNGHGGELTLVDQKPRGLTVRIVLPMMKTPHPNAATFLHNT